MRWESWSFKKAFLVWTIICVVLIWPIVILTSSAQGANEHPQAATYQGKNAYWWAMRAQQARKDANARGLTIKRLKKTVARDVTIQEAVSLASIVYPQLSVDRAWCLIGHESKGSPTARNTKAVWNGEHATGLYQFLPSTYASTPFGGFSIYNPLAQALAAGWMHAHGRGGEWATCR
jgi:hypothetical protein